MGWTFIFNMKKRKDLIEDRIKKSDSRTYGNKKDDYRIIETLKHCYRGASFAGILWTLNETKRYDSKTDELLETRRWIGCDKLQWDNKDTCWGYKDMDESCGVHYWSCPLSYLKDLTEPINEYARIWREEVRKYHADRTPNFKVKKDIYVILKKGWTASRVFRITSVRPLKGVQAGRVYALPRRSLLREITREELDMGIEGYKRYLLHNFGPFDSDKFDKETGDDAIFYYHGFLSSRG
jgi:hypothetical protein